MTEWIFSGLSDRTIGIVGLVASLFSVVYGIYVHHKSRRTKRLVYEAGPIFSIAKVYDLEAPITMFYKGAAANAVYRSLILIWNKGYEPIEAAHFMKPFEVKWGESNPVVGAGIVVKDLGVLVETVLRKDSLLLPVELIRPGEACLVYCDALNGVPTLSMSLELKDKDAGKPFGILDMATMPSFIVVPAGMITLTVFILAPHALIRFYGYEEVALKPYLGWYFIASMITPFVVMVAVHFLSKQRLSLTVRHYLREEGRNVERMFRH